MVKVLRPDFELVDAGNGYCLQSRLLNQVKIHLPKFVAFVLSMFNGENSKEEIEKISEYIFTDNMPNFDEWYHGVLYEYRNYLVPMDKALKIFSIDIPQYNSRDFFDLKEDHEKLCSRPSAPTALAFYMTELCNRQCIYCYAHAQKGNPSQEDTMTVQEFKEVIYEFFMLGGRQILLTGGEALFQPLSYELIRYATAHHIYLHILTKTRLNVDKLRDADISLIDFSFSIDSHIRDTANYLTGSESFFDDIQENIHDVKSLGRPFSVSIVITKVNYPQIQETIDYFMELGASFIETVHYASGVYTGEEDALFIDNATKQRIDEQLRNLAGQTQYKGIINHKPFALQFTQNDLKLVKCSTGHYRLNVKYDGTYYYCDKLIKYNEFNLGNCHSQSLQQLWNSQGLLKLMYPEQEQYAGTVCEHCNIFASCTAKNSCYWVSKDKYGFFERPIEEVEHVCTQK